MISLRCFVAGTGNLSRTNESTAEARAQAFATRAHEKVDQRRKYTGEPYITHPAAVVELVRGVPHTEAMICAAWLHDTVEDTPTTLRDIERAFGPEVGALVEQLTDVSRLEDGARFVRKAIDRRHTAAASPTAKTIKLADLIDNARSILAMDPKFAAVYLAEMALLLEVLREGDATLWARAAAFVGAKGERLGAPQANLDRLPDAGPLPGRAQDAPAPIQPDR